MDAMTQHTNIIMPPTEVTVDNDHTAVPDTQFYQHICQELAGVVNFSGITTSLLHQPLDRAANRVVKRTLDVFISVVMIAGVLSWLTPLLALLICLSSKGPVFFLQQRNKRNGESFTCIKFRSMVVNPDADILPSRENDPRITRIGRFLRRYYIDELPQFLNVLWGDMSVVGPRPHMVSDNLRFSDEIPFYHYRHKVKPGITGLSQVLGYVGTTEGDPQKIKDRVRLDLFYWRHWSLRMDGIILLRTFRKMLGL